MTTTGIVFRRATISEAEYQSAVKTLPMGPRAMEMARKVLVTGALQREVATEYNVTQSAVAHQVKRVLSALGAVHSSPPPPGYLRMTVVLPEHQAFQVQKWATEAARKLKEK